LSTWLIILIIYLSLGVLSSIACTLREPLLLEAGLMYIPLFIIGVIIFPYALFAVFSQDNTGRWI
jgi:hypothetical protein